MTRVNVVPVAELTDQHLFAEWREIKHLPPSVWSAWLKHGEVGALSRIPGAYTLGKGHVLFFHDKGMFLHRRFVQLSDELLARGIKFNRRAELDPFARFMSIPTAFSKEYAPTPEALAINRVRIAERIAARPGWYRMRGTIIN